MTREPFIATKEHRRFTEFADAVKRDHTIGLCYGPAGVGKTLSARRYAHWDKAEDQIDHWSEHRPDAERINYAALARSRTMFYTPSPLTTTRQLKDDLNNLFLEIHISVERHLEAIGKPLTGPHHLRPKLIDLLIIDESERLSNSSLELVRDRYDQDHIALVLIGMPGIEKQFSRFPQFSAASASPTPTGPSAKTNSASSSNATGPSSDSPSTPTTSPTPKRSPRSPASPAATSDSSNASSTRSDES